MTAFETAWALVKDFYFNPAHNAGAYFEPNTTSVEDSMLIDPEMREWAKRDANAEWGIPHNLPTPNEPFRRGGSHIQAYNRPHGTVGVNLSNLYHPDEKKMIDDILAMLLHEDAHAATYHQLPNEGDADEIAAYHLTYPGGQDADDRAREHFNSIYQNRTFWPTGVVR